MANKLRYTDQKAWRRLNGHNPFALADKTLVKGGERRRRIISAAEEAALLVALRACRNIEMPLIFAVALSTGMRRAEVLGLLWSQIDLDRGVINLDPEDQGGRGSPGHPAAGGGRGPADDSGVR